MKARRLPVHTALSPSKHTTGIGRKIAPLYHRAGGFCPETELLIIGTFLPLRWRRTICNVEVSVRNFDVFDRRVDVPHKNVDVPEKNFDVPEKNVDVPDRRVDDPHKIVDAPERSFDVPHRKLDDPARSVEASDRSFDDPRQSVEGLLRIPDGGGQKASAMGAKKLDATVSAPGSG